MNEQVHVNTHRQDATIHIGDMLTVLQPSTIL
jgi:hypothetical protein